MARFYRTASAAPMDYMYQMNIPLMQQALQSNEAGVNQQLLQSERLAEVAAKFNYLNPDAQRAREITEGYSSRVDSLAKAIQSDPMSWRKQKSNIRALARDLESNYRTGEISKIASNYAKYKELDDYISKREEAGKITPYEGSAFRAKALESLGEGTGFNPETGTYNTINTVKPMDTINVRDRLQKYVDNLKANEGLEWDTQVGQYFKKTTKGREYIDPERIISAATTGLMGDTELLQYLKQRSDFGLMNGVFDKNGKFIMPYEYVPNPPSDIDKAQIAELQGKINQMVKTNPKMAETLQGQLDEQVAALSNRQKLRGNKDSSLFPTIQSLADEFSYQKVKTGIDYHNNGLYNLQVNNVFQAGQRALDREQRDYFFKAKQSQADQFHRDVMELGWYKAKNPATKSGTGTGSKGKSSKIEEVPVPTMMGDEDATPWTGSTLYTNEGLARVLDTGKRELTDLNDKMNAYQNEISKVLKGRTYDQLTPQERDKVTQLQKPLNDIQNSLLNKSSQVDWARQWYNNSVDWAVNGSNPKTGLPNLTEEEKTLYNQFRDDRMAKKLEQDIENSAGSYLFKGANTGELSWLDQKMKGVLPESPEAAELYSKRLLLTRYNEVKKKVNNLRTFYLDEAKKTNNQTPAIVFGTDDKKAVKSILDNKTHGLNLFGKDGVEGGGLKILDGEGVTFNPFKGKWSLDPSSDNRAATFADGSLQKYLEQNGGEIEYLSISPSMGFNESNSGAVVKARFKSKNGKDKSVGDLPTNKDFYITLDNRTQQEIGLKYATNTNPAIAALGNQLLSGRDQIIRNRIMDVRDQVDNQKGQYGATKSVLIPLPNGNEFPVKVKSFYNSDGEYDYYITIPQKDGTELPMRSTSKAGNGWFDSIDHFISEYNKNLNDR